MDVENHLYARKDIKQLGIAPMTSMFSCGTNERRMCDTIHPQIHDSDRLSMWRGNGEWICRPLNNPQNCSSMLTPTTTRKGLVYCNWIVTSPIIRTLWAGITNAQVCGWNRVTSGVKGTIGLMEIPTTGETLDNIVCFWQPEKAVKQVMSLHSSIVCTECATACSLPISARYGDAYRHGRFLGRLGAR